MKKYLIQFTFGIIQNLIGLIGFIIFITEEQKAQAVAVEGLPQPYKSELSE